MEKILVVDDSALQAAQLKSILEDDYDVTIANTAEEGLRLIRFRPGNAPRNARTIPAKVLK